MNNQLYLMNSYANIINILGSVKIKVGKITFRRWKLSHCKHINISSSIEFITYTNIFLWLLFLCKWLLLHNLMKRWHGTHTVSAKWCHSNHSRTAKSLCVWWMQYFFIKSSHNFGDIHYLLIHLICQCLWFFEDILTNFAH